MGKGRKRKKNKNQSSRAEKEPSVQRSKGFDSIEWAKTTRDILSKVLDKSLPAICVIGFIGFMYVLAARCDPAAIGPILEKIIGLRLFIEIAFITAFALWILLLTLSGRSKNKRIKELENRLKLLMEGRLGPPEKVNALIAEQYRALTTSHPEVVVEAERDEDSSEKGGAA